jgi:TonB family protein
MGAEVCDVLWTACLLFSLTPGFAQQSPAPAEAQRNKAELLHVLELDSNNLDALSALAALVLQEAYETQDEQVKLQKLEEAYEWYRRVLHVDDRNRNAYYSLGVIDWMKWHPSLKAARIQLEMKPEDSGPLKDAAARRELLQKYGPIIEDGIANLDKALEIDPRSDNVAVYRSLLIRERAELRDSIDEYRRDVREADRGNRTTGFNPLLGRSPAQGLSGIPEGNRMGSFNPPFGGPGFGHILDSPSAPIPTPGRIRVGANVLNASLISKVDPVYPQLAVQARVQGTVHFTAIIDREGHVANLQLIGGHPLLVQAAQDALRQWVYRPTFLNGTPVEVVAQIDIPFTLPGSTADPGSTANPGNAVPGTLGEAEDRRVSTRGVERIRVSPDLQIWSLIHKVEPVYPSTDARVSGTVRFAAIIDTEGRVANLQLISGHPMLVPAAMDAVRQWLYKPAFRDGKPVEVVTQISLYLAPPPRQ